MKLKDLPKKLLAKESFNAEDSPQKVDEILKAKYGFGLYDFSHCLADLIYHEPAIIDSNIVFAGFKLPERYYNNLINKLETLKDTTLKRLQAIESIFAPFDNEYYMPYEYEEPENLDEVDIDWIKKRFKLKSYFREVDEYIKMIKEFKANAPTDRRGRKIRARNLVALIWSYVMKKPDTKAYDWEGMADLFDWFSWNIKGTFYEDKLLPHTGEETFDSLNLKREVLRLKANLKKNEFFREKVNALKEYYFFKKKELNKMSTIDFTEDVQYIDSDYPLVGGEQDYGLHDYNLLIIFPNEKFLPRPGCPPERKKLELPPQFKSLLAKLSKPSTSKKNNKT